MPQLIRVSDADPYLLGVHAEVEEEDASDVSLPVYVERDVDLGSTGLRQWLVNPRGCRRLVLLVGESSVGKSRTAYEAVRAAVPDWSLLQPDDPGQLAEWAASPQARTVVWLDEFDTFLDRHDDGLTVATIRRLLQPPGPVVLLGTMRSAHYRLYTNEPDPASVTGWNPHKDPYRAARKILEHPVCVPFHLPVEFTRTEQDRAEEAARRNPRLRQVLSTAGRRLPQALAGTPNLIGHWKMADTYAKAVLAAAVTLVRLGVRSHLTTDLLRDAAPGYCTPTEKATSLPNWFEQAMKYAVTPLLGELRALSPVADEQMGAVDGYLVADYLVDHADGLPDQPPLAVWNAAISHVHDPNDALRLARAAVACSRHREAFALAARARPGIGEDFAAWTLVELFVDGGDLDLLHALADFGDWRAAVRLADVLVDRGDVDGLRVRADGGDRDAALRLAEVLGALGLLDPPVSLSHADTARVTALLADERFLDQLRCRTDKGLGAAEIWLAVLLAVRGDVDELRELAARDHSDAELLLHRLGTDQDLVRWQPSAGRVDANDVLRLGRVLAAYGDETRLRERADRQLHRPSERLTALLIARGHLTELQRRADLGDRHSASRLADVLVARNDLATLADRAATGDVFARNRLRKVTTLRETVLA
ncbi:hypothetical protein [Frankia gtarii]|uniref:hypothetical protein n=1 Tax=Frankia gtarii TaxID=2950102 RepID=UPI0021C05764|nr:hypothetical protein [Frankia gtarii]